MPYSAQFQVMDFSWFGLIFYQLFGLGSIVFLCLFFFSFFFFFDNLREDILGFFAKQIIHNLVSSCIIIEEFNLFMYVENLHDEI